MSKNDTKFEDDENENNVSLQYDSLTGTPCFFQRTMAEAIVFFLQGTRLRDRM